MTARIERGGAVAIYGTTATRCDLAAETRTHQGLNSTRSGGSTVSGDNDFSMLLIGGRGNDYRDLSLFPI